MKISVLQIEEIALVNAAGWCRCRHNGAFKEAYSNMSILECIGTCCSPDRSAGWSFSWTAANEKAQKGICSTKKEERSIIAEFCMSIVSI
ncbi:hypothetical protein GAMM_20030 [Gammaproteobacteria bacterium]